MATWPSERTVKITQMPILRIALFVSLGLNLFIVGWWVGDASRSPFPMQPREFTLRPVVESRLPPETFEILRPSLDAMDDLLRGGFRARVELFEDLVDAVKAEPYDKVRVNELLARLVDARTSVERQQWELVGNTLAGLDAEQRAAFATVIFVRPGPDMPWPPGAPSPQMPFMMAP